MGLARPTLPHRVGAWRKSHAHGAHELRTVPIPGQPSRLSRRCDARRCPENLMRAGCHFEHPSACSRRSNPQSAIAEQRRSAARQTQEHAQVQAEQWPARHLFSLMLNAERWGIRTASVCCSARLASYSGATSGKSTRKRPAPFDFLDVKRAVPAGVLEVRLLLHSVHRKGIAPT